MRQKTYQLNRWTRKFGNKYTDRNTFTVSELDRTYVQKYGVKRTRMNREFLGKMDRSIKILEIGTNIGNQLLALQKMGFKNLYAIEPQDYAVETAKRRFTGVNVIQANAFDIPYKDNYFDLVFTSGVLIHIKPKDVKRAMKEIHRCSKRYIWGLEYYSDKYVNVTYRGQKNLLWKADFAKMYLNNFRGAKLVKQKFYKYRKDGNVDTMFLIKKRGA
ncbi:MAG: methyltransferase domain-containing protein [Endomicrobiales bacterium]|nr:methyltransferase domain-containing protein [Endomicrobiales bacterium]